jgi:hypothetical protein
MADAGLLMRSKAATFSLDRIASVSHLKASDFSGAPDVDDA